MRLTEHDIPAIADSYVLGLLEGPELETVEAAIDSDPRLRAAVAASRERFLPLDLGAEPATLSDSLWQRIAAQLPANAGPPQQNQAPPASAAANDNRRHAWRTPALTAMAASLLLTIGLGWSLTRVSEPVVIAVLVNAAGEPQAVVEDFGNETARVQLLSDFVVPADRTMQVWTLPSPELGPISLGLLDQRQSALLGGPSLPPPHDAQLYEITLEQIGGSPTGRPTGPILVKGFAKQPR